MKNSAMLTIASYKEIQKAINRRQRNAKAINGTWNKKAVIAEIKKNAKNA